MLNKKEIHVEQAASHVLSDDTLSTHLPREKLGVLWVVCEQEHIYKVDQYAGGDSGVSWSVNDPFKDHHEDEVPEEAQHEEQLRDQHKEYTADLPKVPEGSREKKAKIIQQKMKLGHKEMRRGLNGSNSGDEFGRNE